MKEVDEWIATFRQQWDDRFNQLDNLLNDPKI